ncbi:guanine nucleotide exchange factor DBS-like isoform X2 [Leguminivora glycinivorella]|uniref:guanine nucleotide exchange factor DBS-like isoform X1 n=1 Tax=Leguminivora glycinivorella TaxID=1035111 RepID=UPI00200BC703|nr:guanine nucleotide exchange factor DBS-like isoform X1 [Leguminivora glycinivorella]XP_047985220.1 guanine nucleotide exchange factor DBS-like isoform X2 [Leguminivora glycinivorella]
MANSPTSIETQIDSFLEQFKRSASKAMEERIEWPDGPSPGAVVKSRSSCFALDSAVDAGCDDCGEDEGRLVSELLLPQYALATGGLARDHRPLITFPDNNNFHLLTAPEYRRLLLYLTSVPSLLEADMGFHIIIDRRKDRWNSVKTVLIRISEFFPGIIHTVYVLRPASFLQKALSEVSSKLFKEEFRFRVLVCSSVEELYEHFDRSQLTPDLGGELQYSHAEWIQQRIALEMFSTLMKEISSKLDDFMHEIVDCDMGNDPTQTKELLDCQETRYKELKTELAAATTQGEELLTQMRKPNLTFISNIISHVAAVERLLVQLEETEKQFDNFWQKHSTKLNHWLQFRTFLLNFKQMQATLDNHLKAACDMTEVGETASRVESLIQEAIDFEKLCNCDLDTAASVIDDGEKLMQDPLSSVDHIESKCEELRRTSALLADKIQKRTQLLNKARELMDRIDKANDWCASGVEILAGEGGLIAVDKLLEDAQGFGLSAPDLFREALLQSATQETKALVAQVAQRVEDVWLMATVKRATLQRAAAKPARPVQSVPPTTVPAVNTQMETSGGSESSSGEDAEARRSRRGHVLAELLQTERVYVQELGSILTGYKEEIEKPENQHLLPATLVGQADVLFGNLHELFTFHQDVFLKDLERSISATELVALCFVEKRETFFRLYSYYCQNIPRSERLRETLVDTHLFLQACQLRLGHKLPLAAYLLKPVQRITKYQLLLKDLLRYSECGSMSSNLQQALDCMLVVVKCVNDSMHQIAITGVPVDLAQQGELLMQGSFLVASESKRDLRLRIRPRRRHIFLYEKAMLFCKPATKNSHNKATYHFKNDLQMSQIGLTESVKGDLRKFEVWREHRLEVHTITAPSVEVKRAWVERIKRVLLDQLKELKGERVRKYGMQHRTLIQASSWDLVPPGPPAKPAAPAAAPRTASCDSHDEPCWSTDPSDDEDDEPDQAPAVGCALVALSEYTAVGASEVSLREGQQAELLKVGCAGWWYVRLAGGHGEGWAPAAYLDQRKTSRSSSRSHDRLHDH